MIESITWVDVEEVERKAFSKALVAALALCEQANTGLRIRSDKCAGWLMELLSKSEFTGEFSLLRHLDLLNCGIGEDGAHVLAKVQHLHQLRTLNLGFAKIGPVGAKAIAAAEHFDLLTSLNLTGNQIENIGVKAIANAQHLGGLVDLDLGLNGIDITGIRAFADATHFNRLQALKLDLNRICDAGAELLASVGHLRELISLDLSNNRMHADGGSAIVIAPQFSQLKHLDLSGNKFGDEVAMSLAHADHLKQLSCLRLQRNFISDIGLIELVNSAHLGRLAELNLAENNIGLFGVSTLAASPSMAQLTILNLRRNRITDLGLKAISSSPYLSNLTCLNLGKNEIGDEGVRALAAGSQLRSLQELELSNNKISSSGAQALFKAQHLRSLKELIMFGNEIGDAGVLALATAHHLDKIAVLNLSWNKLGNKSAVALAQATHLRSLRELMVSNNVIGDAGIQVLAKADFLTGLERIDLSYNQIGDLGVQSIAKSRWFTKLALLGLSSNQIADDGAIALAEAEGLRELTHLDLGFNKITDTAAKALALSCRLPKLKVLSLIENKLSLRRRFQNDLDQLREYLKFDTLETKRPLLRARCMLIGAPYAGKTILFEALTRAPYLGLSERPRTQGFQRSCALTFEGVARRTGESVNLTIDLWDLGGHTLQHMVHRLFFRAHSLYLLVVDEASLDTPAVIDHWLMPIAEMAENDSSSTLIPVLNPHRQFPMQAEVLEKHLQVYRNKMQVLVPVVVQFNWASKDISALLLAIKRYLSDHPIESYWQVHDEIAEVVNGWSDNYMHEEEFERRLYGDPMVKGILGRFKDRVAGREHVDWDGFYHNVKDFLDVAGIVSLVPPYIILNPRWVSEGLYVLMPPETMRDKCDNVLVLPANKQFREKLQSPDLSLGIPGVFTRHDVDQVLAGRDFIAADRKALLEILCTPRLGLMMNLESIGIRDTYLMPHYLEQFSVDTLGKTDEELESALAQEIISNYKGAQVCQVLTANYWPQFILYQFLVAYWPQADFYLSDARPSFHASQELSWVNRRRIRVESFDGIMTVDLVLYQQRVWCFGFSQQENDLVALNDLMADIKNELHLMINHQSRERRKRVNVGAWIPCPRCMATIDRLAAQSGLDYHDHLSNLSPGSGMLSSQVLQEQGNGAAVLACGHPQDKHRLTRSEWMGESSVTYASKAKELTGLDENHVQGLKALKIIADIKRYSLIGMAPATLAKVNRADASELVAMRRNTVKTITDEWKNLRGDYKDFPKELLKATGRDVLPSNLYQLNAALIEYAELLVKKAPAYQS